MCSGGVFQLLFVTGFETPETTASPLEAITWMAFDNMTSAPWSARSGQPARNRQAPTSG